MKSLPRKSDTSRTIEAAAARGLDRARALGIEVVARGYRLADGARIIGVTSATEPNRIHLVTITDLVLTCDCQAAKHSRYCMHRALTRHFLQEEAKAKSDRRITSQEQALHTAARILATAEQLKATVAGADAPLMPASRAVSIWK